MKTLNAPSSPAAAHTIAILGAGAMGSMVARRAVAHGCRVLTDLDGRSVASVERARAAGMEAATPAEAAACGLILSIVPPSQAREVAQRYLPVLGQAAAKPVFIDCNAVNPSSVADIAAAVQATGARFVDAGIIGGPGAVDEAGPRFYLGGELPDDLRLLQKCGIHAVSTGGGIGAASALKMAYAGMNKGLTGLWAAMILAATRAGAAQALHRELMFSQATLLRSMGTALPDMYTKAWRWEHEMQEIADFGRELAGVSDVYRGLSQLFAELGRDERTDRDAIEMIEAFLRHGIEPN